MDSPVFQTDSGCWPAASSRLPPRSGSSRRLSPAAAAGTGRRPSGSAWVSGRRDRGAAGCPGTRRYLRPDAKEHGRDGGGGVSQSVSQVTMLTHCVLYRDHTHAECRCVWTGWLIRNSVNSVNRVCKSDHTRLRLCRQNRGQNKLKSAKLFFLLSRLQSYII